MAIILYINVYLHKTIVMKKSLFCRAKVWLSRFKYRRGYGVQSPFAYSFFRDILFEELPYYDFDKLKHLSDPYLTKHTLQVLYRIVNKQKPGIVLDIFPSSSSVSGYIGGVSSRNRTISLVQNANLAKNISKDTSSLGIYVEVRSTNVLKELMQISASLGKISFAHIGICDNKKLLFEVCRILPVSMAEKGVVVIDGIDRDDVKDIWMILNREKNASVAFDLYDIGILFFNTELNKEYYKVNY